MPHVMGTLSALKNRLSAVVALLLAVVIPLTAGKPDGASPSSSLIPPDARLVEAAFTADLDGDGFSDIRARLVSSAGAGEWTILLGSADARPLYLIAGSAPFDPWAVLPGDSNRDGAVDERDLAMWMHGGSAAELFVFSMFEGMNIFSPLVEAVRADEVSRPFPAGLHVQVDRAGAERLFPGNVFVVPGVRGLFADALPPGVVEELMAGLEPLLGDGAGMEQGVSPRGEGAGGVGSSGNSGGEEPPGDREHRPRFLMDDDDDDNEVPPILPDVPENALREVLFGSTGRHDIYSDRKNVHGQQWKYDGDEWLDGDYNGNADDLTGDDHRHPLAYTRQAAIGIERVGFRIAEAATLNLAAWEIIGHVGGNPVFTGIDLARKAGDDDWDVIYSSNVTGTFSGSDFIDVWDDWEITWYVKQVGAPAQKHLGSSNNTVYFLLDAPAFSSSNELLHHTVVDLACRGSVGKNRTSVTQINLIVRRDIWPLFATKEIQRVQDVHEGFGNPPLLGYYRSRATESTRTHDLLHGADGQSDAWVHLLAMCLKSHGVIMQNNMLEIAPEPIPDVLVYIFIADWSNPFGMQNEELDWGDEFPHLNQLPNSAFGLGHFTWRQAPSYVWRPGTTPDALDETGQPGQGEVENPSSLVSNHYMFWFNNIAYDPSYGKLYEPLVQTAPEASVATIFIMQNVDYMGIAFGAFGPGHIVDNVAVPAIVFKSSFTGPDGLIDWDVGDI